MRFFWNENYTETIKKLGDTTVTALTFQDTLILNTLCLGMSVIPQLYTVKRLYVVPAIAFGNELLDFNEADILSGELLNRMAKMQVGGTEAASQFTLLKIKVPASDLKKSELGSEFYTIDYLKQSSLFAGMM